MKVSPFLVLFFAFTICKGQNKAETKPKSFGADYGVVTVSVDSSIKKDVRVVHFPHSIGVIFPAAYGQKKFGRNKWWDGVTFFTPDTALIKKN